MAPLAYSLGLTLGRHHIKQAGIAHEAYAQLPGIHAPDMLVGAMLGTAGGALYHELKAPSTEEQRPGVRGAWSRGKAFAKHLGYGAALGAGLADVAGDRARRFITNVPGIASYDANKIENVIKQQGLKGLYQGAILDKPLPHTVVQSKLPGDWENPDPRSPDGWSPALQMRRELMRRGFGVHTDTPDKDFFQPIGSVATSDGRTIPRIQLNERFTDPVTGNLKPDPVYGTDIYRSLFGDLWQKGRYPGESNSDVLGSYSVDRPSDTVARARDYWDYAWEPRLKPLFNDIVSKALKHPSSLAEPMGGEANHELRNFDGQPHSYTRGDVLKSLVSRWLLDNVVTKQPALFDSTVHFNHATGLPDRAFSGITHDQGVTKDDDAIAARLKAFQYDQAQAGSKNPQVVP